MAEVAPMDAALHAKIMRAWHGEDEVSSMTLPASGQIDMGQIRTEVEASGQVSLNDANFRELINKTSGQQQAMSEYYGKSSAPPDIYIWKAGASGASCHAYRDPGGVSHEQISGYLRYNGTDRISLDHSDIATYPHSGIHVYGNTVYSYAKFNGSASENIGGSTAQYSGRWDGNGPGSGCYGRYPCSTPTNNYWNGQYIDHTKYGYEYKFQTYSREQVMGYQWNFGLQGPGGSAATTKQELQNGWNTHVFNLRDAKGGYYELSCSNGQYSNGGDIDMYLISIKAVAVKENKCVTTRGQSRIEEILTKEEYRRYLAWLGMDPDEQSAPAPITPEQWLAENPGKTLPDPDAELEIPEWSPET